MFRFKQFNVKQEKSAMKISTDAVLLGAWCPINNNPVSILDIGAGTGILSLMLAQRTQAEQIDAIEVESAAFEECVENFENAPWSDRLFCFHAGLDEFVEEPEQEYDLIISNPPFFTEDYFSVDDKRNLARFENSLPFEELIEAASILLSEKGFFAVIIPYSEKDKFIALCQEVELYPFKTTNVQGTITSEIKRSLLVFSREKKHSTTDTIVIEHSRHVYTNDYQFLTKDFYLKM
jgi:tRNA1Val (adenine37-N6)-methyltransferase